MAVSYSFDHVHLNTPDVETAAAFYERVFGMRRLRTFEARNMTFVQLDAGGVRVTITSRTPVTNERPAAVDHFAMYVENLDEAIADLQAKGVQFATERGKVGIHDLIFVQAPDGVVVEVMAPSTA